MLKRALSILELLTIGWIILGIPGFYEATNSTVRFSVQIGSIRIVLDLIIIGTLLFRAIQIIKNFKKNQNELEHPKKLEKVIYLIYLFSVIPDLYTWFQWTYFANLYFLNLIIFALPVLLWTVEIIRRGRR